jgi:hypothetical protein
MEKWRSATQQLIEDNHFVIEIETKCFRTEFVSEYRISWLKNMCEKFLKDV